ncbi:uncharacterized protein C8A04DRAFT_28598 [Dichotomopilus funicola]|uniref:Uncharacterized protein n=1 Tax=Dichotomopilus funicola TaxID=1934379 RepID=A0AAN6ZNR1_9PEZI|nr:hypothetical protein C8A04DRAFT_28598 [Dichotomopilus funicola]
MDDLTSKINDLLSPQTDDLPEEFIYILDITKGNPGSMSVCNQLVRAERTDLFLNIKKFSTEGHELWLVYKDVCGQDLTKSIRLLELIRDGKVLAEEVLEAGEERNRKEIEWLLDLVTTPEEREQEKERERERENAARREKIREDIQRAKEILMLSELEKEQERKTVEESKDVEENKQAENKNVEEKGLEGEEANKKGEKESEKGEVEGEEGENEKGEVESEKEEKEDRELIGPDTFAIDPHHD